MESDVKPNSECRIEKKPHLMEYLLPTVFADYNDLDVGQAILFISSDIFQLVCFTLSMYIIFFPNDDLELILMVLSFPLAFFVWLPSLIAYTSDLYVYKNQTSPEHEGSGLGITF